MPEIAEQSPLDVAVGKVPSPWGTFYIMAQDGAITQAGWRDPGDFAPSHLTDLASEQVTQYLAGERVEFDLPLRVHGTDLVRAVCDLLLQIRFGDTRTYGDLARDLGRPAQAIGQACGGNPIPLIIPCHRVLAAHGLGGFSAFGGVETKVGLLRHEGAAGLLI